MPDVTSRVFVFVFGSVVGSFLNVCIHRLPLGESVAWPRSHCPKCKKKIPGYDNIPFLSYVILGGRCRFCRERIPARYPLVELLTALAFLALFIRFGLSYDFILYVILASCLIIATFVDLKHRIIPDEVSLGGAALGFILSSVKGFSSGPLNFAPQPLLNSLLGIIAGAGIIWATGFIFDLVYFKLMKKPAVEGETSSMGGGDVKLMALVGAFLGWQKVTLVFFIAPFFGVIAGLINLVLKKSHVIPYGPFLSLAAFLAIFYADKIILLLLGGCFY